MMSISSSSSEISTMPTDMPDRAGMSWRPHFSPLRAACEVRELANVLIRMPNHATPNEPAMPTSEKRRMTAICHAAIPANAKYRTMTTARNAHSSMRNLPCLTRYALQVV